MQTKLVAHTNKAASLCDCAFAKHRRAARISPNLRAHSATTWRADAFGRLLTYKSRVCARCLRSASTTTSRKKRGDLRRRSRAKKEAQPNIATFAFASGDNKRVGVEREMNVGSEKMQVTMNNRIY